MEGAEPSSRPPRRQSSRLVASAIALLTATGVVGAAGWGPLPDWTGFQESLRDAAPPTTAPAPSPSLTAPPTTPPTASTVPSSPAPAEVPDGPPPDRPSPAGGSTRLATAPPAPIGGGPHEFAMVQPNGVTPVGYDPCRPVHYVLRPDGAPPGGEEMVHAAAARLSEVTGLQFVYDGPSDEPLAEDREPYQPDRYGDRWAPVLVAWQTEADNPALAGDVVGRAGSTAVSIGDGPRVYVSGIVSLDGAQFPEILAEDGGRTVAQAIVLHEFGHLVGLDHVDDPTQLMHPKTVHGVTDFAAGDLTGLARLGRGPCAPLL